MACTPKCINNTNIYGSTDIKIPVTMYKMDWRTSTGQGLRHMFNPPHETAPQRLCPSKVEENFVVDSSSNDLGGMVGNSRCVDSNISPKGIRPCARQDPAMSVTDAAYMIRLGERIFRFPPAPLHKYTTTYAGDFKGKYIDTKPVCAKKTSAFLEDRHADPSYFIYPYQPGYTRFMDPYATTNELTYIPFTKHMQLGVAKKDIITYYEAENFPKCKGFGNKVDSFIQPNSADPIQDRLQFKNKCRMRVKPPIKKRVPHTGCTTEVRHNYKIPVAKQFNVDVVEYPPFHTSPWQDLAAPFMYCKEYCHIGEKIPVHAVVDIHGRSSDPVITDLPTKGKSNLEKKKYGAVTCYS